jgi:hypothetical protein
MKLESRAALRGFEIPPLIYYFSSTVLHLMFSRAARWIY